MNAHEEIAEVFRAALRGDIEAKFVDGDEPFLLDNWWMVSEPTIKVGDWEFGLFIEADWIYDIYSATAPDGREFEFTPRDGTSSMALFLSDAEVETLCLLLGRRRYPLNQA